MKFHVNKKLFQNTKIVIQLIAHEIVSRWLWRDQSSDGNPRHGMIDSGKGKGVFDMHVMSKHNLVELLYLFQILDNFILPNP